MSETTRRGFLALLGVGVCASGLQLTQRNDIRINRVYDHERDAWHVTGFRDVGTTRYGIGLICALRATQSYELDVRESLTKAEEYIRSRLDRPTDDMRVYPGECVRYEWSWT